MAKELAGLEDENAVLKIREDLLRYGLRPPEVRIPVQPDSSIPTETREVIVDARANELCRQSNKVQAVHHGVDSHAQIQRNSHCSQNSEVCGTSTNMDSMASVHHGLVLDSKVEQNNVHGPAGSLNTRLTKADVQSGGKPQIKGPTGSWTWRNWSYNRVPPAIEECVRERFGQGWSKSKLAREFRLNRRT